MAAQETRIPAWRRLGLALKNESQPGIAVPESSTSHSDPQSISSTDAQNARVRTLQHPVDVPVNGSPSKLGKRKHQHEPAEAHDQASKRGKLSTLPHGSTGIPDSDLTPVSQPDNDLKATQPGQSPSLDAPKPKGDPNYRKKKDKKKKSKSRKGEVEESSATNGSAAHGRSSLSPASAGPNDPPNLVVSTETDQRFPAATITPQKPSRSRKSLSDSPSGTERRKSVAFTPDTKKADGCSAQNLFKKWVAEQKGSLDESAVTSEPTSQYKEVQTPQDPKGRDNKKKERKSKTADKEEQVSPELATKASSPAVNEAIIASNTTEPEDSKSETPVASKGKKKDHSIYITYLNQYHFDRENWKFNKAKQNDVIDNSLNIFRIPEEHSEALLEYVQGLKGAGVIERLRQKCEKTIQELDAEETNDQSTMDDSAARKAAHDEALQKRVNQEQKRRKIDGDVEAVANHPCSDGYIRRLRRSRAEALLLALARAAPILPASSNGRINPLTHNLAPPKRDSQKRKRRVDVSSDESSSDSSEDESSSSESEASSDESDSDSEDSSDSSSEDDSSDEEADDDSSDNSGSD